MTQMMRYPPPSLDEPIQTIAALNFFEDLENIEDPTICNALELCEMVDLEPGDLFDRMLGDGGFEYVADVASGSDSGSDCSVAGFTITNCFEWLFPVSRAVQKWLELDISTVDSDVNIQTPHIPIQIIQGTVQNTIDSQPTIDNTPCIS